MSVGADKNTLFRYSTEMRKRVIVFSQNEQNFDENNSYLTVTSSLVLIGIFRESLLVLGLYGGIVGKQGLNILLALDLTVNIVGCELHYQRAHRENTDKVREHHETVERIGDIPCDRRCHDSTAEDDENEDYLIDLCCGRSMQSAQVLDSLASVV